MDCQAWFRFIDPLSHGQGRGSIDRRVSVSVGFVGSTFRSFLHTDTLLHAPGTRPSPILGGIFTIQEPWTHPFFHGSIFVQLIILASWPPLSPGIPSFSSPSSLSPFREETPQDVATGSVSAMAGIRASTFAAPRASLASARLGAHEAQHRAGWPPIDDVRKGSDGRTRCGNAFVRPKCSWWAQVGSVANCSKHLC